MAGRKKTETVEAEVVETAVVPAGKMEFRLINPTEDGFLRRIQWNKEKIVTPEGEVVCADKVSSESAEGFGYISHFATCKARNR